MTEIKIFMEGGGSKNSTKAALRQGMDAFLGEFKKAANDMAWRWRLIPCGSRAQAFRRFQQEHYGGGKVVILLVDSEGPVNSGPRAHLNARDNWKLDAAAENCIHMMVQVMETWIAADSDALGRYYGQNFLPNKLPANQNLEEVSKKDISSALKAATRGTEKGAYHKIWHARDLLGQINTDVVRRKCSHCDRLFNILSEIISG